MRSYLIGRHNDPDVMQHLIPDFLLAPALNAISTSQQSRLEAWEMLGENVVLLLCQSHIWCQEPHKLYEIDQIRQGRILQFFLLCLAGIFQVLH